MPNSKHKIAIVGIGASAGGIEAFKAFFENMPPDSGMAFVVVLHLPIDHKSLLPEILSRWTQMRVIEIAADCLVEADCVYVPPPGNIIILRDGRLYAFQDGEPRPSAPIDIFFNSMALALRENAIGIVLSGTGSDGTLGLKAIKKCGGLTLAQGSDGTAPMHEDMPSSAIIAGVVDIVASVEVMPRRMLAVLNARSASDDVDVLSVEQTNAARLAICKVLRQVVGHDFSGYKEKTFMRRVQRRMQVLNIATFSDYVDRLENDRAEAVPLFQDLLIGVTSFFRDASTFEILKSVVLPRLFKGKNSDDAVRVWVAGCATGEEAYSLAILLREQSDALSPGAPKVQIFASDIDDAAIATARNGRYPSVLLDGISPDRLARFFIKGHDGGYTVARELREICTFSAHSLTRDPPFSRIDLISCRNLLIYMDTALQARVIPAFHYALVPDGILLLGSSETIAGNESLFSALDRSHRIFTRLNIPTPSLQLAGQSNGNELQAIHGSFAKTKDARFGITKMINKANNRILEKFAPAFVVVSADGEILQFSNHTGRFLEAAPGLPSQNVLTMARHGLRPHLRRALKKAIETGRPFEQSAILIPAEPARQISLAVEPMLEDGAAPLYLIVFIETGELSVVGEAEDGQPFAFHSANDRQLETELRDTQEQLQSITEEHDTALEELRSANEELHSVNEELQSTNEELETSKEEIQSINEELQTVNSQLAVKVDELDARNTDLKNLFESTRVATVFLDPYLVIRGFTPAIAEIYNLIPSDQGRPLTHIVSHLRYTELREDVSRVLSTLEPLEKRIVRDDETRHYLMRILPYRAPDSTVDGTLITFVDVTSIVKAEEHQRLLVDELNHRVKNMLTVVISLATQTLRRSQSLEEFSTTFLGRIHALTAAYALLSKENWQTVQLHEVMLEELKPFRSKDGENITFKGSPVSLEPRAALALGMAVHELTTNAIKYGALSVPEGTVNVSWRNDEDQLIIEWLEKDGPSVDEPSNRGLGLSLIERGLKQDMSAKVELMFLKEGLKATIKAPFRVSTNTVIDI